MIRFLPFLVELAFLIFCIIDVIISPDADVRNLPKWAWLLLIILVPLIGGIIWLVLGRRLRTRPAQGTWSPGAGFPEPQRPQASTADIDAKLQADLEAADRQHEEALKRWEADLAAREQKLTESDDERDGRPEPGPPTT